MQPIDFLLFSSFIIVVGTAILICFIYKCLQYFARRSANIHNPTNILPLYEKEILFKDFDKDESFLSQNSNNDQKSCVERPTNFLPGHFISNTNKNQFIENKPNNETSNSYKFFNQTYPLETIINETPKSISNIPTNGISDLQHSESDYEFQTYCKPSETKDENEKSFKEAAIKSEIPSYDVAISESKTFPLSTNSIITETLQENNNVKNLSNQNQEKLMVENFKIQEIKALFVAINLGTQKQSADALTKLAEYTVDYKDDVIQAKAVPCFIRHLDITKTNLCKISLQALANLSYGTDEQKEAIIEAEGMDPLMECLSSTDLHIQAFSAFTLANIISDKNFQKNFDMKFVEDFIKYLELTNPEEHEFLAKKENTMKFFEHRLNVLNSVLPLFMKLLNCNYVEICKFSLASILNFVNYKYGNESHSYELREALIRNGAFSIFVQFLQSPDHKLCKFGTEATTFIAGGLTQQKQGIINANAIPALIKLLLTKDMEICFEVTKALSKIVAGTNDQKQAVIDAGGCPLFVELLSFPDFEISTEALKALASISAGNLNQQKALYEADCIPAIIQFLNDSELQKCNFALVILFNIINKAPERNEILIKNGGISYLSKLLINEDQTISFLALRILENISCGSTKHKQSIVQAFAISPLMKLLNVSKGNTYKIILNILINIAMGTSEQRQAVTEAGGIFHFCKVLQSTDSDMVKDVIKLFAIISHSHQRQYLIESTVITAIVSLLKSSNNFIVEHTLETLQNISAGTVTEKALIIKTSGAIPMIVYLMHSEYPLIVEKAVRIILNIAKGTNDQKQVLIDAGVIPVTIQLLQSSNLNIYESAINVLDEITKGTKEQMKAIKDADAIPTLQNLLKSPDDNISKIAGNILYKIINSSS